MSLPLSSGPSVMPGGYADRLSSRGPSGPAADPLLAALVDLFLPERHALLQLVDRVLTRRERVLAGGGRDRDHHRGLPDPDTSDTMMDRDRGQLVPRTERLRDLLHHPPPHPPVRP